MMKNLLGNISEIDSNIRELEKNNSKLENGHFIQAHNSYSSLIYLLKETKIKTIKNSQNGGSSSTILEDVTFLDKLIRELEKINSKIENGNIVFAWRDNRRVLANLQTLKSDILKKAQGET
jgi:hypothetical protein